MNVLCPEEPEWKWFMTPSENPVSMSTSKDTLSSYSDSTQSQQLTINQSNWSISCTCLPCPQASKNLLSRHPGPGTEQILDCFKPIIRVGILKPQSRLGVKTEEHLGVGLWERRRTYSLFCQYGQAWCLGACVCGRGQVALSRVLCCNT